ncbi:Ankyrin repeat domain-containing protein [Bordetella sputigena]|uniref:hypothetical protein n=1 Tax=Bordetella sputigena TaxID=1416810 RepID=UPI0039EE2CDD
MFAYPHLSPPSFDRAFWVAYTPAIGRDDYAGTQQALATLPVSYSEALHGSHNDFCNSPDFAVYTEEVRSQLSFLAEFCRRHEARDHEAIAAGLRTFFNHRFDDPHYFSTRAAIVDSHGKQSLDEFCWMIRHEAIDAQIRKAAVRDLALGITECADGAVSNLVSAARKLALAIGGIRGKLWSIKEETARNTLLAVVHESFAWKPTYHAGNEIHYVTTAWNSLAPWYGFEEDADGMRMPEAQEPAFLALCSQRLRAALTPDRLARTMAESCQARFNSHSPPESQGSALAWTPAVQEMLQGKLREIGEDFGLTWEDGDRLDAATQRWTRRESDLRLGSFVVLEHVAGIDGDAGDGACAWRLRTDPSLIALDILRTMAELGLLSQGSLPRNLGEWIEDDETRAALFVYGELAWVARATRQEHFDAPLWQARGLDVEPATLPDLRQWQDARLDSEQVPPATAIHQAVRATAVARLTDMPIRWLNDGPAAESFLLRLGPEAASAYLAANAPSIAASAARCASLLRSVYRAGMGKAIPELVRQWRPRPAGQIDMVYRLMRDNAIPGMFDALLGRNAETAVMAWYAPLRDAGLFAFIAPKIGNLLGSRYMGSPVFASALRSGRPAPVQAFFLLLKELLKDPHIRRHIKNAVPDLLRATDFLEAPSLSFAMASGHAKVVRAFYTGLSGLLAESSWAAAIRPPLLAALPDLLVADSHGVDCGLAYAMANGHTAVIEAFHAILKKFMTSAITAPRIRQALPDMLDPKDGQKERGIVLALERGHAPAAAAFEAICADPLIRPHLPAPGATIASP